MNGFFRNRPLVVTSVVIIILLMLMIGSSSATDISGGQTVAGGIFVPVQRFFYQITESIDSSVKANTNSADLASENADLKTQIAELQMELSDYEELKQENERLTEILNYQKENSSHTYVTAQVTAKDPGNWFDVFDINVGTADGIEVGMPVVTTEGVVGTVKETGANWSKVVAIIDGRSGISSIVERTRDVGSVRGRTGNDPLDVLLDMDYLPMSADIQVGDRILTSGVDEVYPKGLLIGEVVEISDDGTQKSVVVNPAVDFSSLEEVMVMVSTPEDSGTVNYFENDEDSQNTVDEEENTPADESNVPSGNEDITNETDTAPEEDALPEEQDNNGNSDNTGEVIIN